VDPASFRVSLETVAPMVAPEDLERLKQMLADFSGGGGQSFQTEFRVFRPDGELRWCFGTATPTLDAQGRLARVSGVTVDITERKQAEERQLLLAREVDHRARNALAVVQAIVRLTRSKTKEGYIKSVEGRIHALAQAHTLLSESRWQGAEVRRLVQEEVAPYSGDSGRVALDGPEIELSPERSQNLALVLHELATNSAKYGALSVSDGRLAIRWSVGDGALDLRWEESGGPPVVAPHAHGFGTKIINASIRGQVGGNVAWDWRPSGLHCTLQIPLGGEAPGWSPHQQHQNLIHLPSGSMKRVLLVEDEAMIAIMMRDLLVGYGVFVVGPCCSLPEALAEAKGDFDCAFLDLNLSGEYVYPVASQLAERGIPYVFVTGYGGESIDPRFAQAPILQKPITPESVGLELERMLGVSVRPRSDAAAVEEPSQNLRMA
jgi:two-component sensor histidine kinase/CheY-like chemotaxis protein